MIPIDFDLYFASNQTITSTSSLPPSSLLYQLGYNLLLYQLGYNLLYISTGSFWKRSPTYLTKPKPSSLLDGQLARNDYLQISTFPIRWWWSERHSIKKSYWRSHEWSGERDSWLNVARLDSWDVNISFYQVFLMW